MRRLLRLVVERGTGKKADVAGYLVGGKTGTAEKVVDGGYRQKAMLSSFVGAFPIHDPKYVVLAMLDEPHGNAETRGEATGGWVAAPVVGRMIARMAPILGMAPIADDRDDIKQAMHVDIGRKADGVKHLASY
jgi:cell division protein FtsI (penicillin-binding protein 3)